MRERPKVDVGISGKRRKENVWLVKKEEKRWMNSLKKRRKEDLWISEFMNICYIRDCYIVGWENEKHVF